MLRSLLLILSVAVAACAAGQSGAVFEGLKNRYGVTEALEFQVENTTSSQLLYWVQLQGKRERDWYLIYSSLEGLRSDMAEPVTRPLAPGERVTVQWLPGASAEFIARNSQNSSREYRLVLKTVRDLRDENESVIQSRVFRID